MSLRISGVAMIRGDKRLFHDISTTIPTGQKVALIGANGSGKSSLLHIIAGKLPPLAGSVHLTGKALLLEQLAHVTGNVGSGNLAPLELQEAEAALKTTETALAEPTEANLTAYADAEERYRRLGGYEFKSRAAEVLAGLGLELDSKPDDLSGGEQRRWLMARLLLTESDILLLDEPTNHLDVDSREWLERWLLSSAATVLFVSHDRTFLDNVATRVLELERGKLLDFPGNYSQAMRLKAQLTEAHLRAYQAQERKVRNLETEMHKLASKARSADHFNHKRASGQPLILAKAKAENVSRTLAGRQKALEKRLERSQPIEKPFEDTLRIRIPLPEHVAGPREVLRASGLSITRDGLQLLASTDLHVAHGQKIALTGPNGAGKTSLLYALRTRLEFGGEVTLGPGISVFEAWQHGEELEPFMTVGEALLSAQSELRKQDVHYLLAQLDLPRNPDFRVEQLSGGQRTKLALARLAVTRAQLLVLDEPSNNLDLAAVQALEDLLVDYPGTVLFASHDRSLVQRVASHVWHLHSGAITVSAVGG